MLSDFQAMLDNFVASRELESKEGPTPASAEIIIYGYQLGVHYLEDRDLLMFKGMAAFPPSDEKERADLFAKALSMNHGFSETGGACIGFDPSADIMTFQLVWPFSGLTLENFGNIIDNVVGIASEIMRSLAGEDAFDELLLVEDGEVSRPLPEDAAAFRA